MGGAQGSMMHPYDNMDLKICDFIDIARQFTKRAIWAEKVDGINITWSYSGGTFYIARNKDQLQNPVAFESYRSRLVGHPARKQFEKGLNMIEAIGIEKVKILEEWNHTKEAMVWVNTELIDSEAPQMLQYSEDSLVIHNFFTQVDGIKINHERLSNSGVFKSWNESPTRVYSSCNISLPAVAFSYFMDFESTIYRILGECDLTPQATLADITHSRVYDILAPQIHPESAWQIADNVSQKDKHDIRIIKRNTSNKGLVSEYGLSKNRMKVRNKALRDVKDAWLTYGAKVLEDVCSTLVLDPVEADSRLQDLFAFNSNFLATLKSTDQMYLDWCMLYTKYRKYNVPLQIIEGIVFSHGEYLYKLTGAFQLQNRLTGIARYQYGQTMELNV